MTVPHEHPVAHGLLIALQEALTAGDLDAATWLHDDDAVVIGVSEHAVGGEAVRAHLESAIARGETPRWEWAEVETLHETDETLILAAFGDVVTTRDGAETRRPLRVTVVAVVTPDGWRLKHWHGSLPADG